MIQYHDDFVFIKSEMGKLSGADFAEIIKRGEPLFQQSKDTRLALYLVLAKTVISNLDGFMEGLGDLSQSTREEKYLSSFDYGRIIHLLPQDVPAEKHAKIKLLLDSLNIAPFNKWLSEKNIIEKKVKEDAKPPGLLSRIFKSTSTIESIQDMSESTKVIIEFCESQKLTLQAAYYRRALRWGGITELPVNNNNITLISPPREVTLTSYELCEEVFMEPGGVFWLDLHYSAIQLTTDEYLANYIKNACRELILRFPQLIYLSFSDGKPFASEDTRQWLLGLIEEKSENQSFKATKKIRAKDLYSHLKQLKSDPVIGAREVFDQEYAMAKACVLYKRHDLAMALYEKLDERIGQFRLDVWEPELALSVLQDFYQVASIQRLTEKMSELQRRICQLDILRGVKL